MTPDEMPLTGRRIALPESRELDLFADMLTKRGAEVVRCPLVSIHDAPDPQPVLAWMRELIANPFDQLILLTGEGLRRMLALAARQGGSLHDEFVAALGATPKLTRGPKPGAALRKAGLRPDRVAVAPTTEGVIETLKGQNLNGLRIGVQLYGTDPNRRLVDFLTDAGASVSTVAPYIYADDVEDAQVDQLIDTLLAIDVDAIAFTSATQVRRLLQIARRREQGEPALLAALAQIKVAAVGPVVADELRARGIQVDLMPESSFFMKPLVRELVKVLG
ncbi:uroporphyrinogen III methyltransferase [Halopseudomonas oceani]|uniref:Uroporphyrinogen III synthase HEM4 n=1 Tax=Halopseudomonas oceani TaxID=1708783 RepID=A0A2P4EY42_9GAMM|nr:uroporphyrinogen-III synthase [Halopseudomonas oceani]POB05142.1 uroporphyrinogen III synthase HEM4 [Halopseudomonas oceani]GGE33479.1 uroporphyrinogen III methyltransferase [Halopseudomonas oceani]